MNKGSCELNQISKATKPHVPVKNSFTTKPDGHVDEKFKRYRTSYES
tara:strand:- start:316 stop:456 length:141 start_codon:yes stop_codon:yes gene_type:complete